MSTDDDDDREYDDPDFVANFQHTAFSRLLGQSFYAGHLLTAAFVLLVISMNPEQLRPNSIAAFVAVCLDYYKFMLGYLAFLILAWITSGIAVHLIRYCGELTDERKDSIKGWVLLISFLYLGALFTGCTSAFVLILAVAEYKPTAAWVGGAICFIFSIKATISSVVTMIANRVHYNA